MHSDLPVRATTSHRKTGRATSFGHALGTKSGPLGVRRTGVWPNGRSSRPAPSEHIPELCLENQTAELGHSSRILATAFLPV